MVELAEMQTKLRKFEGTSFCRQISSRWPIGKSFFSLVLASCSTVIREPHLIIGSG